MHMGNDLRNCQIGIIGCGHLGRTLARRLLDTNFPSENLRVSYGGRPSTLDKIRKADLEKNVVVNEEICSKSDLIFITFRPQDFHELKKLFSPKQAGRHRRGLIISCMAGISTTTFKNALGFDVLRIMPSGPDTIQAGKGIVAVFPHHDAVITILTQIGLKVYEIAHEELMHIFTVGVCLPAVLLAAERMKLPVTEAMQMISIDYPVFSDIYSWARNVLPTFNSDEAKEEYITKMVTTGGVTESLIESIDSGDDLITAVRKGIARSKELAEKANTLSIQY
ncbi:MAG TPA: hypothetical protein DDW65_15095 [Firmicutes bacterium]|jgi:pyrroline-5-carboxylate reductase|nr:hypothetical protein [Bacillota bacterium]